MRSPRSLLIALLALSVPSLTLPARTEAAPLEFHLTFDPAVSKTPFTGRVYILLSRRKINGLSSGINWFRPEPTFARDVKDWKPGETLALGKEALGYPVKLADLPRGTYFIQAVMDLDRGGRRFTRSNGNGYSLAVRHELDPKTSGPVTLKIDQVYHAPAFRETDRVKLVDVPSKLLTAFHGRPMRLRAGVILPESWAREKTRRYPVVYEIPGFGGSHTAAHFRRNFTKVGGVEMIWVMLDPECRLGHHVFADSANNGPCGRALIEELIPAIEQRFRGVGKPWGRFVTGHSSGGWSSLWLQVTYPDFFGGVWSTSPDPVDFRDFQRIDLYRPGVNMFRDAEGKRRPLARRGDKPILFYQDFSDMEVVMGRGGQLASFEAVFSPRGEDGQPRKLWDRKTGAVDAEVARAWQRYDIRLVLERNWKTLGSKLAGKLHVYTGGKDTFYLEGAVKLLKASLEKLGSDAVVEIVPGKHHGNLVDRKMRQRIFREMAEQYRRHAPAGG
jgi:S-formylglutathione hydrolase FrmB